MSASARWQQLTAFCLFVGYGRSGHSAVGSIIDAHPRAAVSHELDAVGRYLRGIPRDALFDEIFTLAQRQAREGRESSRADGGTYRHVLDGQRKADASHIKVLGDKKGAATAWHFARRGLDAIDDFKRYAGVPLRMIHVIRNPFDIVAAGLVRGGSEFPRVAEIVSHIRRHARGHGWLDVYYEDLLADPRREVARLMAFLDLDAPDGYLERITTYLYRAPHTRRFEVTWSDKDRAMVERTIARHDFLGRYGWED